jgi:hypothetical protein
MAGKVCNEYYRNWRKCEPKADDSLEVSDGKQLKARPLQLELRDSLLFSNISHLGSNRKCAATLRRRRDSIVNEIPFSVARTVSRARRG